MRRYLLLLGLLLILVGLTTTSFATTMDDIVGIWNVTYAPKIKVSGVCSDSDVTYGTVTFNANETLNAYEDDNGIDRYYSGTFYLDGGKTIVLDLLWEDIENTLSDWLTLLALEEGLEVSDISFNVTSFVVSPSKISQKTNVPGKVKITANGTVNANIDGEYQTANFSYKCTITFNSKQ